MVTSSQPENDSLSLDAGTSLAVKDQSICDSMNTPSVKKKDKKLVFLSRSVLQCVRDYPMTTGTAIANEILELYKRFSDKVDFKNVQRRVYDALNVLSAMEIITKHKNHIVYNEDNEFIDDCVEPSTVPKTLKQRQNLLQQSQSTYSTLQKILKQTETCQGAPQYSATGVDGVQRISRMPGVQNIEG